MTDSDKDIDWSKTTFEGSRREQLRRWRALTLRQRLEALDRLSDLAGRPFKSAGGTRAAPMQARGKDSSMVQEPQRGYTAKNGRNEIVLHGCAPTPLASYLKALAVLRLVAEQANDPEATGCWRNDGFVLVTQLSTDELLRFFREDYQPAPLVAPWGARSGFYPGSSERSARAALDVLATSTVPRLEKYREMIRTVRAILKRYGFSEKASDEKKLELLNICRSELPEDQLSWLDACYVLTAGGRKFPPLLGTGGNEGSGSYVSGFAQQVIACVLRREHDAALTGTLFGSVVPDCSVDQTPGHFSPQALGGSNATTGFEARLLTNPWEYLLALEGTLLFAASATRQAEFSAPQVSFPFCVAPLADGSFGYGVEEERPRQAKRQVMELWLPVWDSPSCIDELKVLFCDGRVTVGRRSATTGLDFARAISSYGVDRGISGFQRFSFLMRNGQSFFAAPMERFIVRRNTAVDLITELERGSWLWSVQRYARDERASNAFRATAQQLDGSLFALSQRTERVTVEKALRQVGRTEALCANSSSSREKVHPAPELSPQWVRRSDDGSAEFRIALSLGGLSLRSEVGGDNAYLGMRPHLVPVTLDGRGWEENSRLACWGAGSLESNLAVVLQRRQLEAVRLNAAGEVLRSRAGASLADVQRFIEGGTDDRRIGELLSGLVCVDLGGVEILEAEECPAPLPVYALLKPFFTSESMLRALDWLPPDRNLRLPAEIPTRLASGDVAAALGLAWLRLRALGVKLPGREPPSAAGIDGARLLAALMIPLTFGETGRLLRWLELAPETELTEETLDESA